MNPNAIPLNLNGLTMANSPMSISSLNDRILQRTRAARAAGWNEQDIQDAISQNMIDEAPMRQQLMMQAQQPQPTYQQPTQHKGNFLTHLLPTIGGVLGAAGLAAAPFTGGASLLLSGLGGVVGSVGGRIAENKLEGANWKDRLGSEAVYGALGGALPMARGAGMLLRGGEQAGAEALGQAAGNVAGDVAAEVAPKVGRLTNIGNELRADARGLNVAGLTFPSQTARMGASEALDAAGLKGSARTQFRNIDEAIKGLGERASTILGNNNGTADVLDIMQRHAASVADAPNFAKPAFQNAMGRLQDMLISKADQNTGQITAQGLNEFKQTLADHLSSAFDQLKRGRALSPENDAYMSMWRNIDNEITSIAPEAKNLTRAQSILINARPVLDKAANKSVSPFGIFPTTIPTKAIQSGQDVIGRLFQKAGAITAPTAAEAGKRGIKGIVAGQLLPRLLSGQLGGADPNAQAAMVDPNTGQPVDLSGAGDGMGVDPSTGQPMGGAGGATPSGIPLFDNTDQAAGFVQSLHDAGVDTGALQTSLVNRLSGNDAGVGKLPRDKVAQILLGDLGATGGANFDKILTMADYLNQEGKFAPTTSGSKLSTQQQQSLIGLQTANNVLDELSQMYSSAGGGQGRVGGIFGSLMGKAGLNNNIDAYNQVRDAAVSRISRALGEVGTLTDADIKRASGFLPKITDNPQVAARKMQAIRNLIEQNARTVYSAPTSSSDGSGSSADLTGVLPAGGY